MPRSSQQQYVKHEEATLDEETVQFEAGSWNDAGAPSLSDNASDYALMRIRLSQQTTRLTWLGLTLGTFLLPVCFGAVHPNVYLPYQICAFSLSILLLFKVRPDTANWRPFVESLGPSTIWAGAMLLVLAAYFLLHYLILVPVDVAHPILQDDRGAVSAFKFWTAWRELLTVCSVFFISSIALRSFRNAPALLIKRIISAAVMVSIIALAHWFYDSGRLFWIFEPNTVVPSDRARWPFVNSNSLAQFLCLPLMLLIGLMIERWQKRSLKLLPRNLSQLSYTLGGKSSQKRLAVGIALVLSCLSMSLAFISTLSRAGWLGLSLGLLCLVVTQVLSSDKSKAIEQTVPSARKLGVRRQRRLRRSRSADRDQNYLERGYQHILRFAQRPSKLFQITALIIVLALVLGFLGNRGRELVQGRVEYGLAHSKDDIRLTLYQDSVRMIEDYPIFGVGLAGWGDVFPRYMSDPLAGMNPVYAHSEPLQLQAEGGLVGSLIVISFLIATLTHMFRAIMRRSKHRAVLIGLLSGWVALLTTALLDFPFRIPATNFYVAIVLALTTFYIDRSLKEPVQAD